MAVVVCLLQKRERNKEGLSGRDTRSLVARKIRTVFRGRIWLELAQEKGEGYTVFFFSRSVLGFLELVT